MSNPRHILITGASSGLGAALAMIYAAPECRLSLHGRNSARLSAIAQQARSLGAIVETGSGDVTDAEGLKAWIESRDAEHPIDLLIANAGISAGTGHGGETSSQSREIFAVNLTGVLNTVQPVVPLMTSRRSGQIAIMSSLAGFCGLQGAPSYSASKAAVRIYGEALRGELAPHGIKVNVICPGFIATPMTDVNPFPMPFIMKADMAARIIRKNLAANHARIAFPWPMHCAVRLLAALPQGWRDGLFAHVPRKPSFDKS